MRIVKPSFHIEDEIDADLILRKIEKAGRTCYMSEDKATPESAPEFVRRVLKAGHESVIEHISITVRIICDRGVSHEIVRHRVGSYSQESTRYCNYGKDGFNGEITVIAPCYWPEPSAERRIWRGAMEQAEKAYLSLLEQGASPQMARSVLPSSLKTELVVTYNLREWRHFLTVRTSAASHPQMREIAIPLLKEFQRLIPVVFDDISC